MEITRTIREAALSLWHFWPVFCARDLVAGMWRALPGPWWVKILLLVICQLIPGGFDEWALIAGTRAYRTWRAHRQAAA
jgi:hypothetical protein